MNIHTTVPAAEEPTEGWGGLCGSGRKLAPPTSHSDNTLRVEEPDTLFEYFDGASYAGLNGAPPPDYVPNDDCADPGLAQRAEVACAAASSMAPECVKDVCATGAIDAAAAVIAGNKEREAALARAVLPPVRVTAGTRSPSTRTPPASAAATVFVPSLHQTCQAAFPSIRSATVHQCCGCRCGGYFEAGIMACEGCCLDCCVPSTEPQQASGGTEAGGSAGGGSGTFQSSVNGPGGVLPPAVLPIVIATACLLVVAVAAAVWSQRAPTSAAITPASGSGAVYNNPAFQGTAAPPSNTVDAQYLDVSPGV